MNSISQLIKEADDNLVFQHENREGFFVFNKYHHKHIFIDIEKDGKKITNRIKQGWQVHPGNKVWILRAPETVLCNLSEIQANPTADVQELLTFYHLLIRSNLAQLLNDVKNLPYFKNLELEILDGDSIKLEIRIAGSDLRVKAIPKFLLNLFKNNSAWRDEFKLIAESFSLRSINIHETTVDDCPAEIQSCHQAIQDIYNQLDHSIIEKKVVYGFWQKMPKADIYLFVPKSGIKYALGFKLERPKDKMMLWEDHVGMDLGREVKIFNQSLAGKRVAIIDRSYSGKTINQLAEKVKAEGGEPIKVALFPKSALSIKSCDYFLFLDELFSSYSVNLQNEQWSEEIFRAAVNSQNRQKVASYFAIKKFGYCYNYHTPFF